MKLTYLNVLFEQDGNNTFPLGRAKIGNYDVETFLKQWKVITTDQNGRKIAIRKWKQIVQLTDTRSGGITTFNTYNGLGGRIYYNRDDGPSSNVSTAIIRDISRMLQINPHDAEKLVKIHGSPEGIGQEIHTVDKENRNTAIINMIRELEKEIIDNPDQSAELNAELDKLRRKLV